MTSAASMEIDAAMLKPEEFAILPWSWIPADREMLEGIGECGFNLAGFVAPEALDAVQAAGLCFQLYTTLAYGGRGISYFTYLTHRGGHSRLSLPHDTRPQPEDP